MHVRGYPGSLCPGFADLDTAAMGRPPNTVNVQSDDYTQAHICLQTCFVLYDRPSND